MSKTCKEWMAEHPGRNAIDYAYWLDEEAYKRKPVAERKALEAEQEAYKRKPAAERREIEAEQEAYERERNARSDGGHDRRPVHS